jgi:hypothetical protein
MDSSIIKGVKNQRGITIIAIKKMQINIDEKVLDFVSLKILLYIGEKINVKINPVIIESKIGLSKKKESTMRIVRTIVVVTFLKKASSIKEYGSQI